MFNVLMNIALINNYFKTSPKNVEILKSNMDIIKL